MAEIVHFDNDLYYINEGLSVLLNIFDIEIDETFFFDKIVEDILFFDAVIGKLSLQLKENPKTPHMDTVYRNLFLTQSRFIDIVVKLINNPDSSHLPFSPFLEKFQDILSLHSKDNASLQELFDNSGSEDDSDVISQEEYHFLFREEPEE
ncbi:MAG: hypothetical protein JXB03_12965 [Spirochaetales bacterium]|nr:hypothetical protein [Spirochaetales bacterium]